MKYLARLLVCFSLLFQISPTYSQEAPDALALAQPMPDRYKQMYKNNGDNYTSAWRAKLQKNYFELLSSAKADVLVMPLQVQNYAIDKVGRMLATQYLADLIEKVYGKKTVNLDILARVLGEDERAYSSKAMQVLAQRLSVDAVVWGYIGHDRDGELLLSLKVQTKEDQTAKQKDWSGLKFTDDHPPFEVMQSIQVELVEAFSEIGPKVSDYPIKKYSQQERLALPESPQALINERPSSPLQAAYYYQWLGVLSTATVRENFFRRSLVLLAQVSPESPDYRILKARAYFYLYRRPAAVKILGHPKSAEGHALHEFLNGNLHSLEDYTAKIKSPLIRMISEVEWAELYFHYEDKVVPLEKFRVLFPVENEWAELYVLATTRPDPWKVRPNLPLKKMLDADFALDGLKAEDILADALVYGDKSRAVENIDLSVLDHVATWLVRHGRDACCVNEQDYPTSLDYLWLLEEAGLSNVLKKIRFYAYVQGAPEKAMQLINRYESVFKGNQRFEVLHANTLLALSKKQGGASKVRYYEQALKKFKQVYYLAGQQTETSFAAAQSLIKNRQTIHPLYQGDYPRRHYWFPQALKADFAKLQTGRDESVLRRENIERAVTYIHYDFEKVMSEAKKYFGEDVAGLSQFLDKQEHRFSGHPWRISFMAQVKDDLGQKDEARKLLLTDVKNGSNHWQTYYKIGLMLIDIGSYEKASLVFQAYPGFKDEDTHPVGASNNAGEAASALLFVGAVEAARPLLKLSADYQSGSQQCLMSEAMLNMLNEEYADAAIKFRHIGVRYNYDQAYSRYIRLLFAFDYPDLGASLIRSFANRSESFQLNSAMLLAYQMGAMTEEEVLSQLQRELPDGKLDASETVPVTSMVMNLFDRKSDENFLHRLDGMFKRPMVRVTESGKVERSEDEGNSWQAAGPGPYADESKVKDQSEARSDIYLFARAYAYLQEKSFNKARKVFDEWVATYDFNQRRYKYVLPYYVWAMVKTGDAEKAAAYLDAIADPEDFDWNLAHAFLLTLKGEPEAGLEALKKAQIRMGQANPRAFLGIADFALITHWLYEESAYEGFAQLVYNTAHSYSQLMPYESWLHALMAKYTHDKHERIEALAMAIYFNKESLLVNSFPQKDIKQARQYLETKNPFVLKRPGRSELGV